MFPGFRAYASSGSRTPSCLLLAAPNQKIGGSGEGLPACRNLKSHPSSACVHWEANSQAKPRSGVSAGGFRPCAPASSASLTSIFNFRAGTSRSMGSHAHQGQRPADGGFGRNMQYACAVARAAHPRIQCTPCREYLCGAAFSESAAFPIPAFRPRPSGRNSAGSGPYPA